MKRFALAFVAVCSSCAEADQPESARTVAAFEVPLPTQADKQAFLNVVREEASRVGYHLDAATPDELRYLSVASPITMNAAVWRGNDEEAVASAMDLPDNLGFVWFSFSKGTQPERVAAFRDSVMRRVSARWVQTIRLPIMPTGAIPHRMDLVRTPSGYEVDPLEKAKYQLDAGSR
ncbi:hypothetical protein [Sphingomonas psychrotolerans]|uniref:Uncharacterized protein n=1 Tax=Sphingomonas psychrotolerans TaxID=1327635 RepID=A0A2K8MID2_9SPHN|nr:hypothetical protein [Sphingomonas psychrotolerans]ATY32306.1 hypothetical protein CVN68_10210 [Sphingomonas psychrotolerans]